ncbi:hypothetical protein AB6E88_07335 [Providencia hangzhouensis]
MKLKQLFVSLSIGAALFGVSRIFASADEIITLGTKGGPSLLNESACRNRHRHLSRTIKYTYLMRMSEQVEISSIKSPIKKS